MEDRAEYKATVLATDWQIKGYFRVKIEAERLQRKILLEEHGVKETGILRRVGRRCEWEVWARYSAN